MIVTVPAPVTATPARSRLERPTKVSALVAAVTPVPEESMNEVASVIVAIVGAVVAPVPRTNMPG